MTDPSIEFSHVWKRFRRGTESSLRDAVPALVRRMLHPRREGELRAKEFWAVRDVSFEVRPGEALGVIGPNGAGKSTVLKLLSGILRPNQGTLGIHGRLGALIELGAGFHPDLTGRENVYLNAAILGITRRDVDRRYDEIVEFAGIPEFMDTPVKRYSSGMYARLGFAVASCLEPEVLLVDEVLAVGDLAFQAKCFKRMEEFRTSGAAVVFVSHNMRSIATLCSRCLLLIGGQARAMGDTGPVVREYIQALGSQRRGPTRDKPSRVRLINCTLFDASGAARCNFRSGDVVTAVVRARVHETVMTPALGLTISTAEGVTAFHTTTHRLQQTLPSAQAGQVLEARFKVTLNLCPGQYVVGARAQRYDTSQPMDVLDSGLTIFVTGDAASSGIAALAPECTFVARAPGADPDEAADPNPG